MTRQATDTQGFTLVELIMVIIVLGALAAVAVPRLPTVDRFEDTYDVRQVVSSLNRIRTQALAAQCYVLVQQTNGRLDARIDPRCGSDTFAFDDARNFQSTDPAASQLDFIRVNLDGRNTGLTNLPRLLFTPTGAARRVSAAADLSAVALDTDVSDFSASGGTLTISHQSGQDIQIDDTTGYVR